MELNQIDKRGLKWLILGLAVFRVIGIGYNLPVVNLGGVIVNLAWVAILGGLYPKKPWIWWGYLLLLPFEVITTNPLMVAINHWLLTGMWWFLVWGIYGGKVASTPGELLGQAMGYLVDWWEYGVRLKTFREWLNFKTETKIRPDWGKTAVIAIPILLVFHGLFSQINADYNQFMAWWWAPIWEVIRYIFDWDIIWKGLNIGWWGYWWWTALTVSKGEEKPVKFKLTGWILPVGVVGLTVMLFAIFSWFQGQYLGRRIEGWAFRELSVYTQKGFWELLTVAILGYGLSLLALVGRKLGEIRRLLTIFVIELMGIVIFTYHKLGILQLTFGLKDQRILATVAVSLVMLTLILFGFRLWGKIREKQIFNWQLLALVGIVIGLNFANVDWVATRVNPISYYVDGKKVKDYSYLLGNSYDNYSEWPKLWQEIENQGLQLPKETYYWGKYEPICWLGQRGGVERSYIQVRYRELRKKYEEMEWFKLPELMTFNYREFRAWKLIKTHEEDLENLEGQVRTTCR